ncbi:MAG TPA: SDR family oxidoreductase [Acidimicrobiales bacterium]|nr:SDR family oxidoreductase [Acidimicrobiales bacterium]
MRTAIVTGASRGLGRALAHRLAPDWRLVLDARHGDALEVVTRELVADGAVVAGIAGDVTDPAHRAELVARAVELGGVDLLVLNAGALGPSPLPRVEETDPSALAALFEVNVLAPLALVQLALPRLRAAGGTVVAVTSDAATEAYAGWAAYGASKAALEQLHHVLAVEEPALRVYRFDPGDMRTDMHQAAFPGEDISDRPEPDAAAGALARLVASGLPSGRYRAEELVEVPA